MDKNNLVKKIIINTIVFLGMLLVVTIFKSVFGDKNSVVGITTAMSLLILLRKDLTKTPFKNFFILLFINVASGIASYIAATDIWIGIILDFLSLSLIGYYLGYTLTKILIIPFGLQYLFMLNSKIPLNVLPKRCFALIAGVVLIMLSQFIVNRKNNSNNEKESSLVVFENTEGDTSYKTINFLGMNINVHTVRLAFAIRIGLLTALTSFITNYFGLEEGRWMTYTVFSVSEFYSDTFFIKSKKRIQGTIIGSIILVIMFIFIKNTTLRGLLVLVAGYLNSFFDDYRDMMILVTISAVAPLAISNGSVEAVLNRIFFVIIGIILALIVNLFIPAGKMPQKKEAN